MRNFRLEADGRAAEIETPDGWVTVTRCQGRTEISIRRNAQDTVHHVIQTEGEKTEKLFPLKRRSLDIYIRSYDSISLGELANDPELQAVILARHSIRKEPENSPFGPDWVRGKVEENQRGFGRKS